MGGGGGGGNLVNKLRIRRSQKSQRSRTIGSGFKKKLLPPRITVRYTVSSVPLCVILLVVVICVWIPLAVSAVDEMAGCYLV